MESHLVPDWRSDEQPPPNPNSRSSDASRSDQGLTTEPTTLVSMNGVGYKVIDNGAAKKKKNSSSTFLAKQFGMITKGSTASPRRNLKLLGSNYVVSAIGTQAVAATDGARRIDPNAEDVDLHRSAKAEPPIEFVTEPPLEFVTEPPLEFVNAPVDFVMEQHRTVTQEPPLDFISAPIDYVREQRGNVKGEAPLDFVLEHSPIHSPPVSRNMRNVKGEVPLDFPSEHSPRHSPPVARHLRNVKGEAPLDFVSEHSLRHSPQVTRIVRNVKGEGLLEFAMEHSPRHSPPVARHVRNAKGEAPLDFVTERSPKHSSQVTPNVRLDSLSRSHSLSRRSLSVSDRLSYSHASSLRSGMSIQSIPETLISSVDHKYSRRSMRSPSRTSVSSLAEWSSHELDKHGELSIAGLSLGEGRNYGVSRRTDFTSAQSPAGSRRELDYSPDDTDSGVEMYHETTSASPGSFSSRRSSCSLSDDRVSEFEESNRAQYHGRPKHRTDASSSSNSSQAGERYSLSSGRSQGQVSPATLQKMVNKELLDSPSRTRHNGSYYRHRRHDSSMPSSLSSRRHNYKRQSGHPGVSSKVVVLLGKNGDRKGLRIDGGQSSRRISTSDIDKTAIPLDSITPQEAVAVFHDEVARMMLEEGQDGELHDVEEFLDGYMRLSSPFYLAMVDDFFRAVCVDCYKRPVELAVEGTSSRTFNGSGSYSNSSRSLRSESHPYGSNRIS